MGDNSELEAFKERLITLLKYQEILQVYLVLEFFGTSSARGISERFDGKPGVRQVQRLLKKMGSLGLVDSSGRGRNKVYFLNRGV